MLFPASSSNVCGASSLNGMVLPLLSSNSTPTPVATYSANHDNHGSATRNAGISGTLLEGNNLSYSVQQGFANNGAGNSGNASLAHQGSYGSSNISYNYSDNGDSQQVNYGISGGVVAHRHGVTLSQPLGETNVLIEAPLIARGDIHALIQADPTELDALIVPGGFGAAKNLSTFAAQGAECQVDPHLKALSQAMHAAGKPQGFICIAPAMLPRIFDFPLRLTIGTDIDTAEIVEEMGGEHVPCPVDDIVVDEDNKIVTTPAYMLANNIAEAASGIEKLVARVLVLTE